MHNYSQLIQQAIHERRKLLIHYMDESGQAAGNRKIQPHILGQCNQKLQLHAYQESGYSQSPGTLPCWRNFIVENIMSLALVEEHFEHNAPQYNPSNANYHNIIAMIPTN